jgi:hypothetical protein
VRSNWLQFSKLILQLISERKSEVSATCQVGGFGFGLSKTSVHFFSVTASQMSQAGSPSLSAIWSSALGV